MMKEIATFLSDHPWATSDQIVAGLNGQYTKSQIIEYIEGVMIRDNAVCSETAFQQIGNNLLRLSKTRYLLIVDLESVSTYSE